MNILFVTDSFSVPPINGKQLPIWKYSQNLTEQGHNVSIIFNGDPSYKIHDGVQIWSDHFLSRKTFIHRLNPFKTLSTYNINKAILSKLIDMISYELIWVSPIKCHKVYECINEISKTKNTFLLGLNDVVSNLYKDSFFEVWFTRQWAFRKVLDYFRSFFIQYEEKNVIKKFDIIHVQTSREKNNLLKLCKNDHLKVFVAPNGKNEDFFLNGVVTLLNNKKVLMLSQLQGGRAHETKWFIEKVWPKVLSKEPSAKLLIAGKYGTKVPEYIEKAQQIELLGFVDNYLELIKTVNLVVVPTFHGTGIINRILDGLSAGLPVVATSRAAATFDNIQPTYHLLTSNSPNDFAKHVLKVLQQPEVAHRLSENGKKYAADFPTWSGNTSKLIQLINQLE